MNNELVERLVKKYTRMVEGFIPDLMNSSDYDDYNATEEQTNGLRDATQDCAADRIYDEERPCDWGPEYREAGKRIAEHFWGKEGG